MLWSCAQSWVGTCFLQHLQSSSSYSHPWGGRAISSVLYPDLSVFLCTIFSSASLVKVITKELQSSEKNQVVCKGLGLSSVCAGSDSWKDEGLLDHRELWVFLGKSDRVAIFFDTSCFISQVARG